MLQENIQPSQSAYLAAPNLNNLYKKRGYPELQVPRLASNPKLPILKKIAYGANQLQSRGWPN
jgi:hypothetical protein